MFYLEAAIGTGNTGITGDLTTRRPDASASTLAWSLVLVLSLAVSSILAAASTRTSRDPRQDGHWCSASLQRASYYAGAAFHSLPPYSQRTRVQKFACQPKILNV
ncbi:hypothetical protein KQX54_018897 [Cotesia glomerata]|uniref:Uncharacterized protein n=1 Tax=Cotesia glomerata TaxID=32391 RepID=A0AAV7J020_COTGL|nr:hypothetical protein KQX54_018897 [Cotesia glomerata]